MGEGDLAEHVDDLICVMDKVVGSQVEITVEQLDGGCVNVSFVISNLTFLLLSPILQK